MMKNKKALKIFLVLALLFTMFANLGRVNAGHLLFSNDIEPTVVEDEAVDVEKNDEATAVYESEHDDTYEPDDKDDIDHEIPEDDLDFEIEDELIEEDLDQEIQVDESDEPDDVDEQDTTENRNLPMPTFIVPATGGTIPAGEIGIVMQDVSGDITVNGATTALILSGDYTITGTVNLTNGSLFYMTDGVITGTGSRGITASGASRIYMSGGEIIGNAPLYTDLFGNGGGVHLSGGSIMEMSGDAAISENASQSILNCASTTQIAVLDGGSGGGVFIASASRLEMNGGRIYNNESNSCRMGGGGVRIVSGGTFTLEDGDIHNNTSFHTGVAQASTGGGGVSNTGTFNMNGGHIYHNFVNHNGGGVLNNSVFNFSGGIIGHENPTLGNDAGGGGGGIHISGGSAVINFSNEVYIIGNQARGTGGGGGITRTGGNIQTSPDAVVNVLFNQVLGANNGGGVRFINAMTMTFDGWFIYGNSAHHGGGAQLTNGTFSLGNSTIENNLARTHGGGIRLEGASLAMIDDDAIIYNNTSNGDGGGVSIVNSGTTLGNLNIVSGRIHHNRANGVNGGGGVRIERGFLTLQQGTIDHNVATAGGGGVLMTHEDSIFNMHDGQIHHNRAESAANGGGGVRNLGGATFNLHGGVIHTNFSIPTGNPGASSGGGGVNNSAIFNMFGGAIYHNTAAMQGGGVRSEVGMFNWYSGEIGHEQMNYGNRVNQSGGGIHIQSGTFNLRGDATKYLRGNQTLNTIANGGGGGLNVVGGIINTNLNTGFIQIKYNQTASDGGGVRLIANQLEMNDLWHIGENVATRHGGGGFINGGQLVLNGSLFEENRAESGGGLHLRPNTTFIMNQGIFNGNRATTNGGGIWEDNSHFTIHQGTISNNHAISGDGGGIFTTDYEYAYILAAGAYGNIHLSEAVVFEGNQASRGPLNPSNPLIATTVATTSTSVVHLHPINNYDINFYYRHVQLVLNKESNPESGTALAPATLQPGDVIEYRITLYNFSNVNMTDIIVTDILPDYLSLYPAGLDVLELEAYFVHQHLCLVGDCDGQPTENLPPMPIGMLDGVTISISGNQLLWQIENIRPGDTFTVIIPTRISHQAPNGTPLENTAYIISGHEQELPLASVTTYHIVEAMEVPITGLTDDIIIILKGTMAIGMTLGIFLIFNHKIKKFR